jgi:hypothetical protein
MDRWQTLPQAGGVLDQEDFLMWVIEIVGAEVEEFRESRRKADAKPALYGPGGQTIASYVRNRVY